MSTAFSEWYTTCKFALADGFPQFNIFELDDPALINKGLFVDGELKVALFLERLPQLRTQAIRILLIMLEKQNKLQTICSSFINWQGPVSHTLICRTVICNGKSAVLNMGK